MYIQLSSFLSVSLKSVDRFVASGLVGMYSRCGEIEAARGVFDRTVERDLVTWNCLVDGYARCGEVEMAMEMFEEMPDRDSFSWTCLVDGFAKAGKVEMAREVFDRMPRRNSVTWNAMINGYMKAGEFVMARRLFEEMPGTVRDVISWNSVIAGYEFNGEFEEGLRMFVAMLRDGFEPNDTTLLGALSAVSGLAVLSKGKWVHGLMVKGGVEAEGVLGTALIDMYSKCGSVESALSVFRRILRKKLGHWTGIIVGFGMHGMADSAIEMFDEMRRVGLQPHAITFLGILNACSHRGLVDLGRYYFAMMREEYGIEPTIEHYGCFVDVFVVLGIWKKPKGLSRACR